VSPEGAEAGGDAGFRLLRHVAETAFTVAVDARYVLPIAARAVRTDRADRPL